MKEIIFVFFTLIVSFAYCGSPTSERRACKIKIGNNQTDLFSCGGYLLIYKSLVNPSPYSDGTPRPVQVSDPTAQRQLADPLLLKCLIAFENEKKCNKKTTYIPAWESGS